ncbi:MAG: hypothetical protein WEB60_08285 [Terrimicrobiaceae bacterium]
MNPGAYSRIFKADHDRAIACGGLTGLAVYVALCRIHSDAPPEEKNHFRAGASRIARHGAVSTKTAKRMLPLLAQEGIIEIQSGRRADRTRDNEENRVTIMSLLPKEGRDSQSLGRDSQSAQKGPRIKKEPKGSKRKSRFGGGGAKAPTASGSKNKNPGASKSFTQEF